MDNSIKFEDLDYPTITYQPDPDTIMTLQLGSSEVFTIRRGNGLVPGSTRAKYLNSWQSSTLPNRFRAQYSDMKRYYERNHMSHEGEACGRDICLLCRDKLVENIPTPKFLES